MPPRSSPHRESADPATLLPAAHARRSTATRRRPALPRRCLRHWCAGKMRACRDCGHRGMPTASRRRWRPASHRQARPGRQHARPRIGDSACCAMTRRDHADVQRARTPAHRWPPASTASIHRQAGHSCLPGTSSPGAPIRRTRSAPPRPRTARCNGQSGIAGKAANDCGTRCLRNCAA
ncbi:hypothetical protein D3C81_975420 [compost metagenome]